MSNTVYTINKGINRPIEFKGFKAQYIWYLGAGLLSLFILFAVLYIAGLHPFLCLSIIFILGTTLVVYVSRLSNKYGQHGLMKKKARKKIPRVIKSYSLQHFMK